MSEKLSAEALEKACNKLDQEGYAVIENVVPADTLAKYRETVEHLLKTEREQPYHPDDGIPGPEDAEILDFYRSHYTVSEAEAQRLLARTQHDRLENLGTPWPVPYNKVSKNFIHLPTLFDQDRSQRVWQLVNKAPEMAAVIESPKVLPLVRHVLGEDCNLHDFQVTSIGAGTDGGAWHVDAPLGQLPEPLPEFPLTLQTVTLLDDFTEDNGATRVLPGSHRLRKSPGWSHDSLEDEVILTAPAGSVAMWLSNTWHRSGANRTDSPRRALLCNYNLSWVRGFTDFIATLDPDVAASLSPTVRYLLGYAARPPQSR